jgi:hypothetical protein
MQKEEKSMIFSFVFITILCVVAVYYLYYDDYVYDYINYNLEV